MICLQYYDQDRQRWTHGSLNDILGLLSAPWGILLLDHDVMKMLTVITMLSMPLVTGGCAGAVWA